MEKWITLTESVIGASHISSGKPNQDYIKVHEFTDKALGQVTMLALADGHGSDKYFRSDKGALIAVEVMINQLLELIKNYPIEYYKNSVLEELPKKIVQSWRMEIQNYHEENKLTEKDLNLLRTLHLEGYEKKPDYPFFIYGCTLISVLITDEFIIYIKLGDGDIVYVNKERNVYYPLKTRAELIANEAYSLCMVNPERYFDILPKRLSNDLEIPELIMVSSDGYKNSFISEEGFFKAALDYLDMFSEHSSRKIKANLQRFLSETSSEGSGDDISIAVIRRLNTSVKDFQEQVVETINKQVILERKVQDNANLLESQNDRITQTDEKLVQINNQLDSQIRKANENIRETAISIAKTVEESIGKSERRMDSNAQAIRTQYDVLDSQNKVHRQAIKEHSIHIRQLSLTQEEIGRKLKSFIVLEVVIILVLVIVFVVICLLLFLGVI